MFNITLEERKATSKLLRMVTFSWWLRGGRLVPLSCFPNSVRCYISRAAPVNTSVPWDPIKKRIIYSLWVWRTGRRSGGPFPLPQGHAQTGDKFPSHASAGRVRLPGPRDLATGPWRFRPQPENAEKPRHRGQLLPQAS